MKPPFVLHRAYSDPIVSATSAVDLDTDKAIQEIIRGPDFADVTLLTIACVPELCVHGLSRCTKILSTATV